MIVPPTKSKLIIRRDGKNTTTLVPMPTVIIDTREQLPYTFSRFPKWVKNTEVSTLQTGDYSVVGYEERISLERKTLNDLVGSVIDGRERFIREMERMEAFEYKCLCIEATLTQIKSPYQFSTAHPNGVFGSLTAIAARFGIQLMFADNRELAEEFTASWLSKCNAYAWLGDNGYGRVLQDGDL